jgi:glycosyltransferase involved in cell wall biosynthesis
MNILLLALDVNLENKAGDAIHVKELASSLSKMDHKIVLIVADIEYKTPSLHWAENNNIHLYFNTPKQGLRDLSTIFYCKDVIQEHQIQIIYERRTSPKISYILSKLLKIPNVIEINGLVEEEIVLQNNGPGGITWVKPLKKSLRGHFFKKGNMIVTVTDNIKNRIQKQYNLSYERIHAIPNGANTDLFASINQDKCRKDLNLDNNSLYICFTGNLAPWQGVEYMIEAMPFVLEKIPNVGFIVVGGGIRLEELRQKAKELGIENKVIFTGWVEYEDVPKYINTSDICVAPLTTGREKSGSSAIKIYEYMACGKPVVAYNVPDLEFLQNSGCGILVPRDNVDKLADAIIKLLKNNELRLEMGRTARNVALQKYSWMITAKKISKILEDALLMKGEISSHQSN